jgi:hypothetical protein
VTVDGEREQPPDGRVPDERVPDERLPDDGAPVERSAGEQPPDGAAPADQVGGEQPRGEQPQAERVRRAEQTRDDTDVGWGEVPEPADAHDRWLHEQRPPHWD